MTTGECPSEDQLVRMVEGALSSDSLVGIESHINTCELCMAVVAGLGALNEPPKARTVERYQLDRKIGGGGMGEVWAAWDPKLRREVAVKLVRPDRADEGKERARLLREAQALARLTHPNVVAVHDVGEIDGEVFIATELVAGDTLATRGGPSVDWKTIAGLYAQAARGLAAAHAAGLVHRDVKPANLLVGVDGRVRVADFGLAVRADSNRVPPPDAGTGVSIDGSGLSITAAGHVAGTPAYMAPEQRIGDPPEAPADQFALCVALGEAIAGRRPPIAVTREAMIAFVAERRSREPGLDELCGIIARGTALEPAERFPDMATLAGLLEDLAGTRTPATVVVRDDRPTEPPAPPSEQVRSTAMRKAAVAVAALAIAGTATAVILRDRGLTKSSPAATRGSGDAESTHDVGGSAGTAGGSAGGSSVGVDSAAGNSAGISAGGNGVGFAASASGSGVGGTAGGNGVGSSPAGNGHSGGGKGAGTSPGGNAGTTNGGNSSARRPPPTRVASADDLPSSPAAPTLGGANAGSSSGAAGGASTSGVTLEDVGRAIQRRDGKACRALLPQLTSPPPNDFRVANAHAICEMVAGDCAGGTSEYRALLVREGSPPDAAEITADLYCPLTNDPVVRRRRLEKQIMNFSHFNCDAYIKPLRAAAKLATTDLDRLTMATLLAEVARCYSHREECATARGVLREAQAFNPALQLNELNAACR